MPKRKQPPLDSPTRSPFPHSKSRDTLMSTLPLSVDGQKPERSSLFVPLDETDFIPCATSATCSRLKSTPTPSTQTKKARKSSMPESRPPTKAKTSRGKKMSAKQPIQTTNSSATSVPGSTGNAPVSVGYWTAFCLVASAWLPWRTATVSAASLTSSWSTSFARLAQGSWFTAVQGTLTLDPTLSWLRTSSLSSTFLWRAITAYDQQRTGKGEPMPFVPELRQKKTKKGVKEYWTKPPAGKTKRIRLYPTPLQRKKFDACLGAVRHVYNRTIDLVEKNGIPRDPKHLRPLTFNEEALPSGPKWQWLRNVPSDIRGHGMWQALEAYKSNDELLARQIVTGNVKMGRAKRRRGRKDPWKKCLPLYQLDDPELFTLPAEERPGLLERVDRPYKPYQLRYRSRNAASDTFVIPNRKWNMPKSEFFSDTFAPGVLAAAEPLPSRLAYDTVIQRTRNGEYYLCLTEPLELRSFDDAPHTGHLLGLVAALDPGVRTFMTVYDSIGRWFKIGDEDRGRLNKLRQYKDKLLRLSKRKSISKRTRYTLRRKAKKQQKQIESLVSEIHKKLTLFLVTNYRVILIPTFRVSEMVKKVSSRGQRRRIRKNTVGEMLRWGHSSFRKRLLEKAREYPWCRVIEVSEAHTTQTCGKCGTLNKKVHACKVYRCVDPNCDYEMDRDVHGARNILIRFLTECVPWLGSDPDARTTHSGVLSS